MALYVGWLDRAYAVMATSIERESIYTLLETRGFMDDHRLKRLLD
jgi:hypothetical protein